MKSECDCLKHPGIVVLRIQPCALADFGSHRITTGVNIIFIVFEKNTQSHNFSSETYAKSNNKRYKPLDTYICVVSKIID